MGWWRIYSLLCRSWKNFYKVIAEKELARIFLVEFMRAIKHRFLFLLFATVFLANALLPHLLPHSDNAPKGAIPICTANGIIYITFNDNDQQAPLPPPDAPKKFHCPLCPIPAHDLALKAPERFVTLDQDVETPLCYAEIVTLFRPQFLLERYHTRAPPVLA
jgi:hypothetical protein